MSHLFVTQKEERGKKLSCINLIIIFCYYLKHGLVYLFAFSWLGLNELFQLILAIKHSFLTLYTEKNFFECVVSVRQSNLPEEKDSLTKEKDTEIWVVIKMKITLSQIPSVANPWTCEPICLLVQNENYWLVYL